MKGFLSVLLGWCLTVTSVVGAGGLQTRNQNQKDEKIVIQANEVMVDVVVRDKKGRPVTGLTASDCQIYEDGVQQHIQSFREVKRQAPSSSSAVGKHEAARPNETTPAPVAGTRDPFAGVSVIALVFDRLSPNARALARRAALSYVNDAMKPDDLAGVFAVDLTLHVVQTYTNSAELLKQAIERAASQSAQAFASNAGAIRDMSARQESLENQGATAQGAAAAAAGPGGGAAASQAGQQVGASAAEAALNQMALNAAEMSETIERNEQGYATTYALLSIVNSLREVPGRKAVVFFSEGLVIPPAVESPFRAVISAANRANVSFYPIDAAGLRTEDIMANSASEFNTIARKRSRQVASGREDTSGRPMSRDLERNEDLLRLDPHSGLGMLADQTGGFLVSDTNDLAQGVRRIDEDMRVHYELTYIPKNQEYDGKFRTIAVKVDRSGLEIQTRKGYYAVDVTTTSPILSYEAPALAAIHRTGSGGAFPLKLKGFNFPEATREGLVAVFAEAPARGFTYAVDKEKKQFASDFSIIALIRNESGQVVSKLSHHYVLTGAADKVGDAAKGDILFFREAQLQPGKYTIDTIAYDAPSARSVVKTSSVEVLAPGDDKLRLSSIVLLRSAERLSEAEKKVDNPFHLGDVLVYPNLGEPVRKSASKQLACYFTVYVAKGAKSSAPGLSIEITRNHKTMVKLDPALPGPDQSGRIQYANAFALDAFQPGEYELKVTVSDGKDSVTRYSTFAIEQ